jgi:hypothetical protein
VFMLFIIKCFNFLNKGFYMNDECESCLKGCCIVARMGEWHNLFIYFSNVPFMSLAFCLLVKLIYSPLV